MKPPDDTPPRTALMQAPAARPRLVAIAGCTCSGKSSLAEGLAAHLGGPVMPVDAYYRDLSHLPAVERARVNFDAPDAIEHERLLSDLRRLLAGEPAARPLYDFTTHTRQAGALPVQPAAVVILEGLFALYWEEVRRLAAVKVFVDLDDAGCLERRLDRDVRERGRTSESVLRQYAETVRPMAFQFVLPTRDYADLVVSGRAPLSEGVRQVSERLLTRRPPAL